MKCGKTTTTNAWVKGQGHRNPGQKVKGHGPVRARHKMIHVTGGRSQGQGREKGHIGSIMTEVVRQGHRIDTARNQDATRITGLETDTGQREVVGQGLETEIGQGHGIENHIRRHTRSRSHAIDQSPESQK